MKHQTYVSIEAFFEKACYVLIILWASIAAIALFPLLLVALLCDHIYLQMLHGRSYPTAYGFGKNLYNRWVPRKHRAIRSKK